MLGAFNFFIGFEHPGPRRLLKIARHRIPTGIDKVPYWLAPVLVVMSVVGIWAVVPFAPGFLGTDLELTLRTLGAASVVVCGVLTNVCPFATAMEAFMRGFRVYYPADATAALNRDLHVGALATAAGWFAHVVCVADLERWVAALPGR